jgi:hypothetical protein
VAKPAQRVVKGAQREADGAPLSPTASVARGSRCSTNTTPSAAPAVPGCTRIVKLTRHRVSTGNGSYQLTLPLSHCCASVMTMTVPFQYELALVTMRQDAGSGLAATDADTVGVNERECVAVGVLVCDREPVAVDVAEDVVLRDREPVADAVAVGVKEAAGYWYCSV